VKARARAHGRTADARRAGNRKRAALSCASSEAAPGAPHAALRDRHTANGPTNPQTRMLRSSRASGVSRSRSVPSSAAATPPQPSSSHGVRLLLSPRLLTRPGARQPALRMRTPPQPAAASVVLGALGGHAPQHLGRVRARVLHLDDDHDGEGRKGSRLVNQPPRIPCGLAHAPHTRGTRGSAAWPRPQRSTGRCTRARAQ
jgi:hypothetical protein